MTNSKGILFRRCIAYVIDWNLVFLIGIGLFLSGPRFDLDFLYHPSVTMFSAYGVLLGIVWFALFPFFKDCMFKSASLGKWVCGIKVYDGKNGGRAKISSLVLRNITFYIPFVELIFYLCNKGKTLGDVISGSIVDLK